MNTENKIDFLKEKIIDIFAVVATFAVPLFFENRYFNIIKAKADAYWFCSVFLIAAIAVYYSFTTEKIKLRPSVSEIILILFALNSIISMFTGNSPRNSFTGAEGWRVGTYAIVTLIILVLFVKHNYRPKEFHFYCLFISVLIISLLAILHSAGIDVFGLHRGILEEQYYSYVSTIGNVNAFSGYLCLVLPLMFGIYLKEEDARKCCAEMVVLFLGITCITLCNCDSLYLGLGFCAFFAIIFVFNNQRNIERFIICLLMYAVSLLVIRTLPVFAAKRETFDSIQNMLCSYRFAGMLAAASTALLLVVSKIEMSHKQLKVLMIFFEAVLLIVVCTVVVYTYEHMNPYWGNNRWRIWDCTITAYKTLRDEHIGLRYLIFGVGPENLLWWYRNLSAQLNTTIKVAHSEPLQTLLTLGNIGFYSYLMFYLWMMGKAFVRKIWNSYEVVFFLPIMAYLGQAFVNSMSVVNAVLLALITGIYLSYEKEAVESNG